MICLFFMSCFCWTNICMTRITITNMRRYLRACSQHVVSLQFSDMFDVHLPGHCFRYSWFPTWVPSSCSFFSRSVYIMNTKEHVWIIYTETSCWMVTGARQANRIRRIYLDTILRQDITFFDTETTTGEVVGRMSGDTILIQDAMSDKVRIPVSFTVKRSQHVGLIEFKTNLIL